MSNETETLSDVVSPQSEPLASFDDFNLQPEVLEALGKMGFSNPTPVQAQCYECAMSGVDAVIMAQTGTGKTAAFGIPTVQRLDMEQKAIQALVLVPTRELAVQVSKEISAIGKQLGSKCIPVYGGTSFSNQVREYESGAQIIVGTPGRVLDHIKRKTIQFNQLKTVVLDEADEMLSMGFEKELREIMDALPKQRQTMLFSATIPDDIRRLAGKYMEEFVTVSVSGDEIGASQISHFVYLVSGMGRVTDLVRVLDEERPGSAIIFCNTKEETQFVCNSLCDNGYQAKSISSDLSQVEREKVLGAIRENKIQFLVATDVAARGIDISHLSHVINFSFPDSLERYIHRTGRTGRQGKHGAAISLITPQDIGNLYMLRLTYKIFPVEKKLPDVANKALQDELAMLDYFRTSVVGTKVKEPYYSLATRLLQASDAQFLMGNLLQQLFDTGQIESKADAPASQPNTSANPQSAVQNSNEAQNKSRQHDKRDPQSTRGRNHGRPQRPSQQPKSSAPSPREVPHETPKREQRDTSTQNRQETPTPAPQADPVQSTPERVSQPPVRAEKLSSSVGSGDIASLEKSEDQIIAERSSIIPDFSDTKANTDIYMDAGRKDGLKISALMKEIVEKTGLQRTDIGKVRMLTRSTFITVPNVNCQAVYKLLSSLEVCGRKLKVEYAQES